MTGGERRTYTGGGREIWMGSVHGASFCGLGIIFSNFYIYGIVFTIKVAT
jgi:hypothetical protein